MRQKKPRANDKDDWAYDFWNVLEIEHNNFWFLKIQLKNIWFYKISKNSFIFKFNEQNFVWYLSFCVKVDYREKIEFQNKAHILECMPSVMPSIMKSSFFQRNRYKKRMHWMDIKLREYIVRYVMLYVLCIKSGHE